MRQGAAASRSHTLVIHPGALGDVLLAVPALRALRAARGGERLVLGAQERIGALLGHLRAVDAHARFDALGLDVLFTGSAGEGGPSGRALVEARHVVCWFGARDPAFVARLRALRPGAVVTPSVGADGLVWEHLLATVGGDPAVADRAPLAVPAALVADGHHALRAAGWDGEARLLMVHPGAGGVAKRWPAEGFARVQAALGSRRALAVAVHQGPADADAVAELAARDRGPVIRLVEPTLPLLAAALRHVAAFVGNDSGVSHLAAAVGVSARVLFTASNLAWRPWCDAARAEVVDTAQLRAADVERVIARVAALLGRP